MSMSVEFRRAKVLRGLNEAASFCRWSEHARAVARPAGARRVLSVRIRIPGMYLRVCGWRVTWGNRRATIQGLEVVQVLLDQHVLLIKGALPGPNQTLLEIRQTVKRVKARVIHAPEVHKKAAKKEAPKASCRQSCSKAKRGEITNLCKSPCINDHRRSEGQSRIACGALWVRKVPNERSARSDYRVSGQPASPARRTPRHAQKCPEVAA